MKENFLIDYLACILFRVSGPIIRSLPKGFSLFLGRRLGDLFYYFDYRHRAIAYANIKRALASGYNINRVTKDFYRNFGQNLIEIFFIPLINEEYIKRYITIEGKDNIEKAFKEGKGVIFAAVHEGNWELSNLISSNLGFIFVFFARVQKYPRLNKLLNSYRLQKGCRVIERTAESRQDNVSVIKYLIENLRDNHGLGMTVDQGGKNGILVKFFGKDASMPTGAIRLALKYRAVILPAFYVRIKGPYHKIIIKPAFNIKRTLAPEKDIHDNLQELVKNFEDLIRMYPQEYLWFYKIWKYSRQRSILILSDGKAGHLRQSEALVKIITDYLKDKNIETTVVIKEVIFKNRISRHAQVVCSLFAGKYQCQGCQRCLRKFVANEDYDFLASVSADIVISCGSSMAAVNYVVSSQNQAKSIVIMRPLLVSMDKFNLVVMPKHDNPPKRKNVIATRGALNLMDEQYLQEQSKKLLQASGPKLQASGLYIGFLIGGNTKNFHLSKRWMKDIITRLKYFAEKTGIGILISTSRRTSKEIELLIKEEFGSYPHCPFLIVANEKNFSFGVGGILALSKIVIVTPESISMISEAASSGRYVIVCKAQVDSKHNRFLNYLSEKKHIYLVETNQLSTIIDKIWQDRPEINRLDDKSVVREAVSRVI